MRSGHSGPHPSTGSNRLAQFDLYGDRTDKTADTHRALYSSSDANSRTRFSSGRISFSSSCSTSSELLGCRATAAVLDVTAQHGRDDAECFRRPSGYSAGRRRGAGTETNELVLEEVI